MVWTGATPGYVAAPPTVVGIFPVNSTGPVLHNSFFAIVIQVGFRCMLA